ncbi:MAG TPA: hypothetical protein PLJ21_07415 [Pseudobdellovibrionaceae bacterium]|nr:hypothetical protein [Pseudobdellovibrionaceae bacterium]
MLNQNFLKNQKGIAVFESIPIILVMILLLNFSIGFFGVVHTGILNSIASRNFTFETFRHRADNKYFRDKPHLPYSKTGYRFHGTISEFAKNDSEEFQATARPIDFFNLKGTSRVEEVGDRATHNSETLKVAEGVRNEDVSVNPVWIKTKYGICLDKNCGDK